MAIEWVSGFIIPIIKTVFIGGLGLSIAYFIYKAISNAWSKSFKFFLKYKIMRRSYPEKTLKWVLECINTETGWYDAKKLMMIHMIPNAQINETLWIYDQVIITMGNKRTKGDKNVEQNLPKL